MSSDGGSDASVGSMRDEPRDADMKIEWAILVLGLAGVVAIWLPFAGLSVAHS
jgi:hypothetical protein